MRPLGSQEARTLLSSIVAGGRLTLSARVLSAADVDLAELLNVLRTGTVEPPVWSAGQWRYPVRAGGKCAVLTLRLLRQPGDPGPCDRAQPTATITGWSSDAAARR